MMRFVGAAGRLYQPALRWLAALSLLVVIAQVTMPEGALAAEGWPRRIESDGGSITLTAPPKRVVSTSVTLTGSLLAIDAPVIASGATAPNTRIADDQGFLLQWGPIAKARRVQRLYIGAPDLEAIAVQAPDLIVVSASGADSALKLKDQLAHIAPTLVIDYDDSPWQAVTRTLGRATGHEQEAEARIQAFDAALAATRRAITLPPQPVSAFTWPPGQQNSANLWTDASAQGRLLKALGMTLAPVPAALADFHRMGQRHDILPVGGERLADALAGKTWLIFAADDAIARQVAAHPFLAQAAAVREHRIFAVGNDTFRLDYYSAMQLLTRLHQRFAPPPTP